LQKFKWADAYCASHPDGTAWLLDEHGKDYSDTCAGFKKIICTEPEDVQNFKVCATGFVAD
jgi:hypothetical protein